MKNKLIFTVLFLFSGMVFADNIIHAGEVGKEKSENLNVRTNSLEKQVRLLQKRLDAVQKKKSSDYHLDSLVEIYARGPAVVTSPALGVRRSAEDASDLMVNLSSINEDLHLLKLRKKMDNYAIEKGIPVPERPIIALSGGVEVEMEHRNKKYSSASASDVNLSRAEIDVISEVSPWVTAAIIAAYDDGSDSRARRTDNSRFKLDRGSLTIGQLNKSPLYSTIGQIYAPFGSYSTHMVTDPSTKILGRVKGRMAVAGYSQGGFNAQVYGFSSETKVVSNKNVFGYSGFNAGFDYAKDDFQVKVGASIIGNLAESDGMQKNIFAKKAGAETINSRVAGIDGRIKLGYAPFAISAEYVGAASRFDKCDLSFNQVGAKPQALNLEGSVDFETKSRPSNFAVGYGQTWQALALGVPKNNFFAEYDVAILKNTIFSVEYRHDVNYGWNDVGAGNAASKVSASVNGRHANIVTAQIGVYF